MGESDEESDPDDFIVDESGQPIATKKKHKVKHSDAALQEAQDIFGVDFDFTEFEQYGEEQVRKLGRVNLIVKQSFFGEGDEVSPRSLLGYGLHESR